MVLMPIQSCSKFMPDVDVVAADYVCADVADVVPVEGCLNSIKTEKRKQRP